MARRSIGLCPAPSQRRTTRTMLYMVDKGMIRVSYKGQSKVTQLGGSAAAPEGLARIILSELVREVPSNV